MTTKGSNSNVKAFSSNSSDRCKRDDNRCDSRDDRGLAKNSNNVDGDSYCWGSAVYLTNDGGEENCPRVRPWLEIRIPFSRNFHCEWDALCLVIVDETMIVDWLIQQDRPLRTMETIQQCPFWHPKEQRKKEYRWLSLLRLISVISINIDFLMRIPWAEKKGKLIDRSIVFYIMQKNFLHVERVEQFDDGKRFSSVNNHRATHWLFWTNESSEFLGILSVFSFASLPLHAHQNTSTACRVTRSREIGRDDDEREREKKTSMNIRQRERQLKREWFIWGGSGGEKATGTELNLTIVVSLTKISPAIDLFG